MTVLVLTLAGPMQAWGSASRFTNRATDDAPTKSGVVGLLAAARGLRRSDPLEDLLRLRFGVRIDQPGQVLRDFQTARSLDGSESMPLSHRWYRADARYVAAVEGPTDLLQDLDHALRHPVFPLYLGRRSCPPSEPLSPRLRDLSLAAALQQEPWQAAPWWRRRLRDDTVDLEYRIDEDAVSDDLEPWGRSTQRDMPVSFDPEHRQYGWRTVAHGRIHLGTITPPSSNGLDHDPMPPLE